MKTMRFGLVAAMMGMAALAACTPENGSDPTTLAPQGSYQSAACGGIGTEVLLLVDTSSRMGELSGYKQGSKYLTREQLLVDALKRTIPHAKKAVDFGLLTFPWVDKKDGGNQEICQASCDVGDVVVEPGKPYGWIVSRLEGVEIGGKAAVAAALLKARDFYAARPADGKSRSVVLFTAGGDTCGGEILAGVDALRTIDVNTFIVSYENATDRQMLETAASHGYTNTIKNFVRYLKPDTGIEMIEEALAYGPDAEICDGIDNDCDGLIDEGFDRDGDGYADCMGDCNDNSADIFPGRDEGGRTAPYPAARVTSYFQGPQNSGGAVDALLSNPDEGKDFDSSPVLGGSFALGFDGYIEVEFDCPLKNGDGADLRIFEKTFAGSDEFADVYAYDMVNQMWVKLGQASNLPIEARPNVANDFDLGLMREVNRIRIVNATPRAGAEATSDGFDLNGVYALHDCSDCDGIDNDCDGQTDENFAIGDSCVKTVGAACQVTGRMVCDGTTLGAVCETPNVEIAAEQCDGIDNDCDGMVDEGVTETCATTCGTGHRLCTFGSFGDCVIDKPNIELCNGLDDNCDGLVDEGFLVGEPCVEGQFACARVGVLACTADGLETECKLEGEPMSGGSEICNGLDDNCDGQVDNGKGLCANGMTCFKGQCVYD